MSFKTLFKSSMAVALALPLTFACTDDGEADTGVTAETTGDGDGDPTTGDGDPTGDGDGDPTGDGDGDGDPASGDGDGDPTGDGDGDEATGMLRLMHLGVFPGDVGTDVDIYVNGEAAGISFAFKSSTDYVELPVGNYDFDVVPTGGVLADSVFNVPGFAIAEGDMWEVFASGYVVPEDGNAGFGIGAFAENWADIPAGQNRLNIVHSAALSALTPIDVWSVDDDCEPTNPLLENFEYGSVAADVDLPNVALKIGLDAGQDQTIDACFEIPALGGDVLVNAFAVNDDAGNISIVAHLPDGSSVELLPI